MYNDGYQKIKNIYIVTSEQAALDLSTYLDWQMNVCDWKKRKIFKFPVCLLSAYYSFYSPVIILWMQKSDGCYTGVAILGSHFFIVKRSWFMGGCVKAMGLLML